MAVRGERDQLAAECADHQQAKTALAGSSTALAQYKEDNAVLVSEVRRRTSSSTFQCGWPPRRLLLGIMPLSFLVFLTMPFVVL